MAKHMEFEKDHYCEFTNKKCTLANQLNIHEIIRGSLLVILIELSASKQGFSVGTLLRL